MTTRTCPNLDPHSIADTLAAALRTVSAAMAELRAGTTWHTEGFIGAVLLYRSLAQNADPRGYLLDLWNGLLCAGRNHMFTNTT